MKTPFVISVVIGLHVAAFGSLFLMQGCGTTTKVALTSNTEMPPERSTDEIAPVVLTAVIPSTQAVTPVEWPSETKIYTVRKGDMLSTIGRRFGVKQAELMRLNGITNPNRLFVGQSLVLPGYVKLSDSPSVAPAGRPAVEDSAPVVSAGGTYTIRRGDSLGRIASRLGTSVSALKRLNGLSSDRIMAGKTLKVPVAGSTGAAAAPMVAPTAPVDDADVESLLLDVPVAPVSQPRAPALRPETSPPALDASDVLAVPDVVDDPADARFVPDASDIPPSDAAPEIGGAATNHVVKEGEDIFKIARQYNVLVAELITANGLTGQEIQAGQTLVIP